MPASLLIIDDDETITRVFARVLRQAGFAVRTGCDAESALTQVTADPPEAILVDLRMPMINGVGFLYRLRQQPRFQHLAVAVMTADLFVDDLVRREIDELGAHLHEKPVDRAGLVRIVRALLDSPPASDAGGVEESSRGLPSVAV